MVLELWVQQEFSALQHMDFRQGAIIQNQSSQSCLPCSRHIISLWFSHLWSFMNIFNTVLELLVRHNFLHYTDWNLGNQTSSLSQHSVSIWFSHLWSFINIFHKNKELWPVHKFSALGYWILGKGRSFKKQNSQSNLPCSQHTVSVFSHLWSLLNNLYSIQFRSYEMDTNCQDKTSWLLGKGE